MFILVLIPLFAAIIAGVSAWFISRKVLRVLKTKESTYATLFGVLTFILSFVLIGWAILFIIVSNIGFSR